MSLRTLPGTVFTKPDGGSAELVIMDTGQSEGRWTGGRVRVADVVSQIPLSTKWELIGWSARLSVGITRTQTGVPLGGNISAKLGKLFAGLAVNAALTDAIGPPLPLPSDMSTFTEVWNPAENPGPVSSNLTPNAARRYMPLGITYIFPAPVKTPAGAQLQFALIMTPSLIGVDTSFALQNFGPIVASADFTLLYND